MKREIIAGAILLLILAAAIYNIYYVDSAMDRLSSQVQDAGSLAQEGRIEESALVLQGSLDEWRSLDKYVHIMLRHEEIDPITDEYYALLDELDTGGETTSASFETLINRLHELAEMEHLTFSSIF